MTEGPAKEVADILHQWEDGPNNGPDYDPVPTLTLLAEILEVEYNKYLETNPDPFDERHPSRVRPNCAFGNMLKVIFRKEIFMSKLVSDYLRENFYSRLNIRDRDVRVLNIAASRLILDLLLGLEAAAVLDPTNSETLIRRLFTWVTEAEDPLQSYAVGLLASFMEIQDVAGDFRDENGRVLPLLLDRLNELQKNKSEVMQPNCEDSNSSSQNKDSGNEITPRKRLRGCRQKSKKSITEEVIPLPVEKSLKSLAAKEILSKLSSVNGKECNLGRKGNVNSVANERCSTSNQSSFELSDRTKNSWQENEPFVIGAWQMNPLTLATKQIFILKYLNSMAEYQENLVHIFEKNALELILSMINPQEPEYARVSFEAVKYLAALLCHKKFAMEFISVDGVQKLLEIRRPSISAIGASLCFYYLAYCEDSMDRVCMLPKDIIVDLVRYASWLLKYRHDSGRCHATMFFGFSFQFQIILDEFDKHNGLCDLYNVMSTTKLLVEPDEDLVNEEEESSSRQIIRHVCVAIKRYLEAHLFLKVQRLQADSETPVFKVCKATPESVAEQIETVLEHSPFKGSWEPVNKLYDFGGITLLSRIIMFAYEWNYPGRIETVRSILDILNICCTLPKVTLQMTEQIELPDEANTTGLNVLLGAAEGEIVADPEVQKAALNVIITCVCAPMNRVGSKNSITPGKRRSGGGLNSKALLEKVWECVRVNNGIMVLLSLITIKTPLIEADSIRCLACQALVGLARSETVRQILSVLPLFTSGELLRLMRDPILHEKRQEHVKFQKHAIVLLERVLGKRPDGAEMEVSLSNIHRANVIAQTKIQYNEKQLMMLIHQHLVSRGMKEAATALQKEAEIPESKTFSLNPFLSPFTYGQGKTRLQTPTSVAHSAHRLSISNHLPTEVSSSSNTPRTNGPNKNSITPIRIKRAEQNWPTTPTQGKKFPPKHAAKDWSVATTNPLDPTTLIPQARHVSLDSIVTEYLTNQHALCKNPMVTCPQFNLFVPHKCPDPKPNKSIPCNFTVRYCKGINSRRLDQRLIHSRFCPVKTLKLNDGEGYFTCCEFFADKYLIVGTYQGEVKVFNIQTGVDDVTYNCHESYISNLQCNRNNSLLLTTGAWRQPLSAMWKIDTVFEQVCKFNDEEVLEFSKVSQDRIIGTNAEVATIYDVATKKKLLTLTPTLSNQYSKNRATFNPTDELVLSDGILWDVNSAREIYKFDKLNQIVSGLFHPNGLEIVSNTEIWDLRTFRLLKTEPALDQCSILFSPTASVIYAAALERDSDDDTAFDTSFKTFDPYDYSSIATVDVKKNIYHVACNKYDTSIAIVENLGEFENIDESSVRLYDVGRRRDEADEVAEEDDDEDDMDNSGSGSDDDDDDGDGVSIEILSNLGSDLSDEAMDDNDLLSDDSSSGNHNSDTGTDGNMDDF